MNIEKLIESVRLCGSTPKVDQCKQWAYWSGGDMSKCIPRMTTEAATALSTLQTENEKLRDELERCREKNAGLALALLTECAPNPDCLGDDEWKAIKAELEQVKQKMDIAIEQLHGHCPACAHYTPNHNEGLCRFCCFEVARNTNVEINDNWKWRGPKEV